MLSRCISKLEGDRRYAWVQACVCVCVCVCVEQGWHVAVACIVSTGHASGPVHLHGAQLARSGSLARIACHAALAQSLQQVERIACRLTSTQQFADTPRGAAAGPLPPCPLACVQCVQASLHTKAHLALLRLGWRK